MMNMKEFDLSTVTVGMNVRYRYSRHQEWTLINVTNVTATGRITLENGRKFRQDGTQLGEDAGDEWDGPRIRRAL